MRLPRKLAAPEFGLPATGAYRAGVALARLLPAPLCRGLAEGAGVLAARAPQMAPRRAMVAKHLRRIHGPDLTGAPLARLVDEAFASYARYWAESLRLPSLSTPEVDAGFSHRGIDEIELALDAGGGAILALPHLGGWEWGGTWLARTGHPVTVIVEKLHPPELFEWFVGFRRRLGMEVVAVGPSAGTAALRALRANRVVCLLCDRVVAQTPGVDVVFFGERTQLPAGPVTLALRSGAPLLPAAVYFGSGTDEHLGWVRRPLVVQRAARFRDDVASGTQRLAAELEWLIRRAPAQWHLMQPNWPSDVGYGSWLGPE